MSQAALWHVMTMFHIPDVTVDLLEQIYGSATVHLAPNDAESATITFDTGVAPSPQLFNIFQSYQRSVAYAHGDWAESG